VGLRLENLERRFGIAVVQKDAREPQRRDRAYLIVLCVFDGPLQLRPCGLQVARLELDLG
jgi:hypothetical protein